MLCAKSWREEAILSGIENILQRRFGTNAAKSDTAGDTTRAGYLQPHVRQEQKARTAEAGRGDGTIEEKEKQPSEFRGLFWCARLEPNRRLSGSESCDKWF